MKFISEYGFHFKGVDDQKILKIAKSKPELEVKARKLTRILDEFFNVELHPELIALGIAAEAPLVIEAKWKLIDE